METWGGSQKLPSRLNKDINEAYLWHGTSQEGLHGILEHGFRLDLARCTMFDTGLYFAEASSKSDEYAQKSKCDPHKDMYCMFLCRVAMGEPALFMHGGDKVHGTIEEFVSSGIYDSVLGDREAIVGTYRVFIVYREDQVYPEYLIFYKRLD